MIGKTISHYRIIEKLGGGGMGIVYKGIDTLLDRPVAIKVLSANLSQNESAMNGFLREAKAASALNHPNILTVHDLLGAGGVRFLVMELVEGETLRRHIGKKGMDLKQVLNIALELAEALAAAHRAGIVHRDLKPENIMVRTDGHIKVVDFGLAKLLVAKAKVQLEGDSDAPTLPLTGAWEPGVNAGQEQSHIAGTLHYMAPEQFSGTTVDHRADIFSFGVVLYEMATGQQPFQGHTTAEVIDAIIGKEPRPAIDLSPALPPQLQELISKCLEKDPSDRYQNMEDIAVDIKRLKRASGTRSGPVSVPSGIQPRGRIGQKTTSVAVAITTGLLFVLAVATLVYLHKFGSRASQPVQLGQWGKDVENAVISPDGTTIAFDSDATGQREIYVMPAAGGDAVQRTSGEGDKSDPRFSPNGSQIVYSLTKEESKEIWTVPTLGGREVKFISPGHLADWSPNEDEIAYGREQTGELASVWIADSSGRDQGKIYSSRFEYINGLIWSPDGRWIFINTEEAPLIVRPDGSSLVNLKAKMDPSIGSVSWSSDGQYLLYSSRQDHILNIWKLRVPVGEPERVTSGPGDDFDPMPLPGGNGLIYVHGQLQQEISVHSVRGGGEDQVVSGGWFGAPSISPDKTQIAYLQEEPGAVGTGSAWIAGINGQNPTKIATENNPYSLVWSPDSKRLAYSALVGPETPEHYHIFVLDLADKRSNPITNGNSDEYVCSWSPDSQTILFVRSAAGTDILTKLTLGNGVQSVIGQNFESGSYSQTGKWILATGSTDVPKANGLWVIPSAGGAPKRIYSQAVGAAQWALRDHAIIFSIPGTRKGKIQLWKLEVSDGNNIGSPSPFISIPSTTSVGNEWEATDDLSLVVYPRPRNQVNFYKLITGR
jgi:serine/threonine protein kinase/Tol biopolymer transport system component